MVKTAKAMGKVLQFTPPQEPAEGHLEKWFRGVMQSNHDLMTALERLRDSYREAMKGRSVTERDQAVLMAVEITLRSAKNAQAL
jgi:hypothetical protein